MPEAGLAASSLTPSGSSMDKEYKILLLDDNPKRITLLTQELAKTNLKHSLKHVCNKEAYSEQLREFEPDIIFAESSIPGLTGLEAMHIAQEIAPLTSFILLTSTMDEPSFIEKIKSDPNAFIESQQLAKVKAAVQTALDIKNATEDKVAADRALKEREKLFSVAINNIPDSFVIYDPERRIRFINERGIKMSGKLKEEVIGKKDEELYPKSVTDEYLPALKKAAETQETQRVNCTITLATGTYTFTVDYIPLVNDEGKTYQILGISHDLTERRLAEKALRESEERFRRLLEATEEGIAIHDNGLILDTNERLAAIFGYELYEIVGMNIVELTAPQSRDNVIKNIISGYDRPFEASAIRKDGSQFPVEIIGRAAHYQGKEAKVSIIRDISERIRVEEALRASVAEKEVLIKEIHHRVKNNLQIISSLLKLQSATVKTAEAQKYLKISRDRVQSMAFIHDKLFHSKELTNIDFSGYVRQLTSHLLNSYGVKPDKIKLNLKAENVFLDIDTAVPCGLLVNELVSNCLKHAFPNGMNGEIDIEIVHDSENKINLTVKDNGVGFAGDYHEIRSGSLGLQLIDSLSRQLGGTVSFETQNGTCFSIKFPPLSYTERK
jgi:PAS domain S-box-containing protein